jgi:hypothetical protein
LLQRPTQQAAAWGQCSVGLGWMMMIMMMMVMMLMGMMLTMMVMMTMLMIGNATGNRDLMHLWCCCDGPAWCIWLGLCMNGHWRTAASAGAGEGTNVPCLFDHNLWVLGTVWLLQDVRTA